MATFRAWLIGAALLCVAVEPVSLAATFLTSAPTNLWVDTQPYPDTMLDKFVPIPYLVKVGCLHHSSYVAYWSWDWRWPVYPQYFLERKHRLRLQLCGTSAFVESEL
jgi:hypothetical protein